MYVIFFSIIGVLIQRKFTKKTNKKKTKKTNKQETKNKIDPKIHTNS